MKTGISTASLFLKYLTENALTALESIGADTAEVFLSTYSEYEEPFVRKLKEASPDIDIHSIHILSTQFEPQLFSEHQRVREDAERLFRKVCRAAQILGAKNYTFHGPLTLKKSPLNIDMSKFADTVRGLTDIAADYEVTVCYENIHYGFFSEPEFFEKLKRECPKLGMCLDIKHAVYSDADVTKLIAAAGDRLRTVHVVDMLDGGTALPGKGGYDFVRLFESLKQNGCNAPVLIEAYAKNYNDINELKTSYGYLKTIFQEEYYE